MTNRQYAMDLGYNAGYEIGHRAGKRAGLMIGYISSAALLVILGIVFWLATPAHAETCHDNSGRPYIAAHCLPVDVMSVPNGLSVVSISPEPGCYVVQILGTGAIDFIERIACVPRKSTK